jgi:hypothetical protein
MGNFLELPKFMMTTTSYSWSREEVEATVDCYLQMWLMEQSGQAYSKTAFRRALLPKLRNRTDAAIELKHQNISSILMEHGWQNIPGYKPLGNYQQLLAEVVAARIMVDRRFDLAADSAANLPATVPPIFTFDDVVVLPPKLSREARSDHGEYVVERKPTLARDYLDREARNASLGAAGEEFVLAFEHYRLSALGKKKLAEKVDHVSKTKGDGLGYDVLSFDESGRERFIEVKTTAWSKETPFFISNNEVKFSKDHSAQYHLYRVFQFRKTPRLFDLSGSVESNCLLNTETYRASFS